MLLTTTTRRREELERALAILLVNRAIIAKEIVSIECRLSALNTNYTSVEDAIERLA